MMSYGILGKTCQMKGPTGPAAGARERGSSRVKGVRKKKVDEHSLHGDLLDPFARLVAGKDLWDKNDTHLFLSTHSWSIVKIVERCSKACWTQGVTL